VNTGRIECRGGGSRAKRERRLGAGTVIAGRGIGGRGVARTTGRTARVRREPALMPRSPSGRGEWVRPSSRSIAGSFGVASARAY